MINPLPEVEKIRKYLRYDTKTGLLYWQNRMGNQTWRNGTQAEYAHEAYAIMAYILHGEFANTGYVGRRK